MFSGSSAAKYRRAPRVRALLTLAVGIALVGGLLSSRVYRADLHMLAIAWVVLAVGLLATLALLCLFRGVIGLYYGARPALRVVWIGPFWDVVRQPRDSRSSNPRPSRGQARPVES